MNKAVKWCPKCRRKMVVDEAIVSLTCPQCGAVLDVSSCLHKDPYQPSLGRRQQDDRKDRPKSFQFDQKSGTDNKDGETSSMARAQEVASTFGIEGRV